MTQGTFHGLMALLLASSCQLVVGTDKTQEREDTDARCRDAVDNDGDGDMDCQELSCSGKGACPHVAHIEWVGTAGGVGEDVVNAVTSDPQGNVILAGVVEGETRFGDEKTSFANLSDIFVAKYDLAGGLAWIRRAGGNDQDGGVAVATDKEGNVYVTGDVAIAVSFDDPAIRDSEAKQRDAFVVKYSAKGEYVWHSLIGGRDLDYGMGIVVDDAANIYVTGVFQDTLPYSGCAEVGAGLEGDIFVMKLDPRGKTLWTRCYGHTGLDAGFAIALDKATGHVVVAGTVGGQLDFGGTRVTGTPDLFVARFDPQGTLLWARVDGGEGEEAAHQVAIDDKDGGIVVAGAMNSRVNFAVKDRPALRPDGPCPSAPDLPSKEGFVVKYSADGKTALWARRFGGPCDDVATGLSISSAGTVAVSGTFLGLAIFGDDSTKGRAGGLDRWVTRLEAQGFLKRDAFVTELDAATGNFLSAHRFGGAHDEDGCLIVHTAARTAYVTGSFRGDATFGTNMGINTDPCPSSIDCTSDIFLMELTLY